ncbi:MAG: hypothetical protein Q9166_004708 [cf. Caloplaca sp. 2 TL-2023]
MDTATPAIRPYQQRSAYQPTDPNAYLKLLDLRCIRNGTAGLGSEVRLCSLCMEVALGELLVDDDAANTEYRVAFYELPCGHLRCCSCALKWLDPAGIFHHVCHSCDSKKGSINPDLNVVLDKIDTHIEPDISRIKGFTKGKAKQPRSLQNPWPEIQLPSIQEVKEGVLATSAPETPSKKLPEIQLSPIHEVKGIKPATSAPETPAKKRPRGQLRTPILSGIDVSGRPAPPLLQWTPTAQREEEVLEYLHDAVPYVTSSDEERDFTISVRAQKKRKIWAWANSPEKAMPDQDFEDWVEEDAQLHARKKPRRSS